MLSYDVVFEHYGTKRPWDPWDSGIARRPRAKAAPTLFDGLLSPTTKPKRRKRT
jgi:hypothetical protein